MPLFSLIYIIKSLLWKVVISKAQWNRIYNMATFPISWFPWCYTIFLAARNVIGITEISSNNDFSPQFWNKNSVFQIWVFQGELYNNPKTTFPKNARFWLFGLDSAWYVLNQWSKWRCNVANFHIIYKSIKQLLNILCSPVHFFFKVGTLNHLYVLRVRYIIKYNE